LPPGARPIDMKRRLTAAPPPGGLLALAQAYAQADFSEDGNRFLQALRDLNPGNLDDQLALALGCEPADYVIRFLKAWPGARCEALDDSADRLEIARASLEAWPGVARRCQLRQDTLPPTRLSAGAYDLVLANGLLHRSPDPLLLWRGIGAAGRPGALVLVMDLMRPPSPGWAESLVVTYVGDEPELLQSAYRDALFAAFEPAEVQAQLAEAGLEGLEVAVVSDRHLTVSGRLPG
jgi:SAM-dependent methyltransferase